jgi:glycosyltransferase involved in cell wall biosynthesis
MATGLPVIATRSGGPDSIITPDTGMLIETEDPGQLAEAMEQMILNRTAYSQETIRSHTMEKYGQASVMARYHRLFLDILER